MSLQQKAQIEIQIASRPPGQRIPRQRLRLSNVPSKLPWEEARSLVVVRIGEFLLVSSTS